MASKKKRKTSIPRRLQADHEKFVGKTPGVWIQSPPQRDNLEQPSVLRFVESVTTYGAYEQPI